MWRWIEEDRGSRHSVAITSQDHFRGVYEIPDALGKAVASSGGSLRALSASASKPLEQARELRALCQEADIVALHLWPEHDIIPVIALAAGCESSKTLFVHHSDHTFWVGSSVSHLIVHLRSQSVPFLMKRRGLDPGTGIIAPRPADPFSAVHIGRGGQAGARRRS